jgi:uncharacterized damage-inducible protein DinB
MQAEAVSEFLNYFEKVHQRTMNVVRAIPPDKIDWRFRPDKFSLGDLVRHIAASNRYIFAEVARGRRSTYAGCGPELAASYEDIVRYSEKLHEECVEIISGLSAEDWTRKNATPAGAPVTAWKWLRSMIEHECHHRGQIYIYLSMLEVAAPPIYGLTSEQVRERSVPA